MRKKRETEKKKEWYVPDCNKATEITDGLMWTQRTGDEVSQTETNLVVSV